MTVTYRNVPGPVEAVGRRLIQDHHPDLLTIPVRFVFRSEAAKQGGKTVLGKARKVGGLNAFLASEEEGEDVAPFFLIELAEDEWQGLTVKQRAALIDHELCHCKVVWDLEADEPEPQLKLVAHDLEEFQAVVRRHGLWHPEVEHFAKLGAEQLSLLQP